MESLKESIQSILYKYLPLNICAYEKPLKFGKWINISWENNRLCILIETHEKEKILEDEFSSMPIYVDTFKYGYIPLHHFLPIRLRNMATLNMIPLDNWKNQLEMLLAKPKVSPKRKLSSTFVVSDHSDFLKKMKLMYTKIQEQDRRLDLQELALKKMFSLLNKSFSPHRNSSSLSSPSRSNNPSHPNSPVRS